MNKDYQEIFQEETREQIEKMNDNLLSLEKNPSDIELIEEVYRASHTLKGMAGTMGYKGIQKISHRMEELFDELKSDQVEIQKNLFDLLFECLDAIELLAGDEDVNVQPLIDDLDSALADDLKNDSKEEINEKPDLPIELPAEVRNIFEKNLKEEMTLAVLNILEKEKMPTVKGLQIMRKIDFEYELFWPDPDELESDQNKFYVISYDDLGKNDVNKASGLNIEIYRSKGEDFLNGIEEKQKKTSKKKRKIETSDKLKVDLDDVEHVMNLISELVISKGSLEDLSSSLDSDRLSNITGRIDRITSELRESVLDMKMTEVKNVFRRFPRMVRDLAKENDKKIDFEMEGEDIELDRTILDRITDPVVHLLRNAVDHGIESVEERKDKGKTPEGKIKIAARQQEDNVIIEVSDDGRGLDKENIKKKAIEDGLIDEKKAETMTDEEIYMLIFHPHFSTKEEVTEVSGRGVGMEVVKKTMDSLGGEVNIETEKDEGTTVNLTLPPSVAIIQAFLIRIGSGIFAIPLKDVVETAQFQEEEIEVINGKDFIRMRDEYIPLIYLKRDFEDVPIESIKAQDEKLKVVIVSNEDETAGLVIDEVITEKDIVIKPLPKNLHDLDGFMGATILGDGTIALILNTIHWIRSTS